MDFKRNGRWKKQEKTKPPDFPISQYDLSLPSSTFQQNQHASFKADEECCKFAVGDGIIDESSYKVTR